MLQRFRIQLKATSSRRKEEDDDERLLSTMELHEYPVDTIANASPPVYRASEPHQSAATRKVQTRPSETLSFDRLRRVAQIGKLSSYVDALRCRFQQHSPDQWVILQDSEELGCCDRVRTSSETLSGQRRRKRYVWRARSRSRSDAGLRSSVMWYFGSPVEAGKDCPTLEFLRIHLAPLNVWL